MVLLTAGARADETLTKSDLIEIIKFESAIVGFNPGIAIAIAKVESDLNPGAIGAKGEIGLFQIMPRHRSHRLLFDPRENTKKALEELLYWRSNCPVKDKDSFVICYNSGFKKPKHPLLHPYYKRVIEAMK